MVILYSYDCHDHHANDGTQTVSGLDVWSFIRSATIGDTKVVGTPVRGALPLLSQRDKQDLKCTRRAALY